MKSEDVQILMGKITMFNDLESTVRALKATRDNLMEFNGDVSDRQTLTKIELFPTWSTDDSVCVQLHCLMTIFEFRQFILPVIEKRIEELRDQMEKL